MAGDAPEIAFQAAQQPTQEHIESLEFGIELLGRPTDYLD